MSTGEDISLKLYHYLSKIIGSDDVVKTRQNIFKVMDFVMNDNDGFTFISSGSKAEGIDIKGSDFDRMIVLKMANVNENMRDATYPAYGVFLLMEFTDTPSGFTKLKLENNSQKRIPLIGQCSQTLGQETYISNKLFREYFLLPDMIIHGPCQSLPGDVYDRVVCFRCKTWIASAQPWINRSQSTWPGYKQYRLDACELTASSLSCLTYPTSLINKMTGNVLNNFIRAITCFKSCSDPEVCKYIIALDSIRYIHSQKLYNIREQNKSVYKQFDITLSCSRFGLFSDALSYWLLLASFMYQHKHFKECIDIVVYCLSKSTPDKIFLQVTNSLEEQTVFEKTKTVFGLLVTCKHLIIKNVYFVYPFCLLPAELATLSTNIKTIVIPPVVYSNVLLFLCFHHLRDAKGKADAIHGLELTIRNKHFIQNLRNLIVGNKCLDNVKNFV
ncbi:unnamed protein product [Mytilus coruscus]|uniref:Mab-21-like HhH/H2TH-like domain-containing protein n=1 Tax=Mytilus coruscus TaxID=42192 RepID=A0A6J8E229_MYTCO|nr:unnamed protein product [Mytilus coruscus]